MKKMAFIPFDAAPDAMEDRFFLPQCYELMRDKMAELGVEAHTFDRFANLGEVDAVVCCDVPHPNNDRLRSLLKDFHGVKIALLYECPAIKPHNYDAEARRTFDYLATWDDSLVDGKKFLPFRWPQVFSVPASYVSFAERKLAVMVAGNKSVSAPHELYSERRRAIRFFEKATPGEFDLYGRPRWDAADRPSLRGAVRRMDVRAVLGWFFPSRGYPSYRGELDDKLATLSRYRFCISYENMDHINGYITEKIWDCFSAGTVPVYLGADNVADHIPKECFIDKRDFPDYRALLTFLRDMDEIVHRRYLDAARNFLGTDAAARWHHRVWGPEIGELLARLINRSS